MFNNPGKQLKTLATVIFWIEVASSVIVGFIVAVLLSDISALLQIIAFILIVLYGVAIGWLSGIVLYAFGDLVHDTKQIKILSEMHNGITSQTNDNQGWSVPRQ